MKSDLLQNLTVACLFLIVFVLLGYAGFSTPSNEATGHVASVHYERCDHCKIEVKEEKGFWAALESDPVAFFTMTLFVATVVLAGVTIGLWQDARRASGEQAALTRESLRHAEDSARAANNAIVAANLSSERQLRAYMIVPSGRMALEIEKGDLRPVAKLRIKNSGQTPAKDVEIIAGIVQAKRLPQNWLRYTKRLAGKAYVGPDVEQHVTFQSGLVELAKTDSPIFAVGLIRYLDVFDKRRETYFAFEAKNFDISQLKADIAPCDEGNSGN